MALLAELAALGAIPLKIEKNQVLRCFSVETTELNIDRGEDLAEGGQVMG